MHSIWGNMKRLSAAFVTLSLAAPAAAQGNLDVVLRNLEGTTGVSFVPTMSQGQLVGCGLEINALARDFTYKRGGFIKIGGSVGFLSGRAGQIAVTLKLIVHDVNPVDLSFAPSPPASAYFATGPAKTSAKARLGSYPSDTPGANFTAFDFVKSTPLLLEATRNQKITVAFARTLDGMDVLVPIDLTVSGITDGKRSYSSEMLNEFHTCSQSLLKGLSGN